MADPYNFPALKVLLDQFRNDLASAHAEICKLQGLDPEKHTWPEWSAPANTLRWIDWIEERAVLLRACDRCKAWPIRDVLDGDHLCQACCVKWAQGERPDPTP